MSTENWISLTARFHSSCLECLGDIEEGDQILWIKGKGTKHKECPEAIQKTHEIEVEDDYSTWKNPQGYSYTIVQNISICQKCGVELKVHPKFINSSESGDRRVCEKCFDGH